MTVDNALNGVFKIMPAGINFSSYIALTHKVSFLLSDNLDTAEGYAKPEETEAEPGSVQMLRAETCFFFFFLYTWRRKRRRTRKHLGINLTNLSKV